MAVIDASTFFSGTFSNGVIAGQTVTGTNTSVISTNAYDTQAALPNGQNVDLGKGNDDYVAFFVTTAFAGLTSLEIQFVSADDGALTTNVTVLRSTGPILLANLGLGANVVMPIPKADPRILRRFVGARYVIVGAGSAGAVAAMITTPPGDIPMPAYRSGFAVL